MTFSDPLKSDNIFTSKFTIDNKGNCNIYNVDINYSLDNLNFFEGSNIYENGYIHQSYAYPNFKRIAKHKKQVFDVNMLEADFTYGLDPNKITSIKADLYINISYEYWYFFSEKINYNFKTSELVDGNMVWYNNQ